MYKVIGLRVEKYLGTTCTGHNCDFEYGEEERDRHVILLKNVISGKKVELTLSYEEDQCGSGWGTSSKAYYDWQVVETFAGKNYLVKEEVLLDISKSVLDSIGEGDYVCDIFTLTPYICQYYPQGSYEVSMDMFTPSCD